MYQAVKRIFDCVSGTLLFLVISPFFLLLMLLVRLNLGSPVFFKQLRSTKGERPFMMYKFRTMTEETDQSGNYLPDEKRLTKFGNFLRTTSLDELPELWNIIKGDMSVIGPRPLPKELDEYYNERERLRFRVRGGLIPPEVVHGVAVPEWKDQLEWEAEYAEQISFRKDLEIFFAVFRILFTRCKEDYGAANRVGLNEERGVNVNDRSNSSAGLHTVDRTLL